jgi:hypothetical protein
MGGYRRFCVQCGGELKQGARFCAKCGRPAAASSPQPAVTGPQPAVTGEHNVGSRGLQAPPPSPAWDGSAVPPDGALFPPPRPGYCLQDAPFPRDDTPAAQTMPATLSKGLALPSAYPAAALPAAFAFPGPPAAAGSAGPAPAPDTAQFPQNWVNEVGFSPQWEPSPPSASDVEEADRDLPPPRRLLLAGLIALVAAVIVVPALLIAHSLPGIMGGGSAAAQPMAKQPPRGATATAPSQRTAAAGLATLLAQTAADRISIVNAAGAVEDCTATLGQAPQVFQTAAASRQRLLQRLAGLPARSALPAPMLQELTGAWQASAAVDQDLGRWAQDEVATGCTPGDHADANFQASGAPDLQATNDKTAFVAMWNAIAAKYGLTRYQTSQL